MMTVQQKAAQNMEEAKTEEEKTAAEKEMEDAMAQGMVHMLWTISVVDITSTLHETAQMVLHDQGVDRDVRKRRAYGLKNLGEIFMSCPAPLDDSSDARQMYEEAAFAAMLETIKRKEEAAQSAPVE